MTIIRSFLFVPGDSERKQAKAVDSGADALILDLEDSVAPANKIDARNLVAAFLTSHPRAERPLQIWVRINPLDTDLADEDLKAVVEYAPDGIMLPKANGPEDVRALSKKLDQLETGKPKIKILPVATETAIAPFKLGEYADAGLQRLYGLTWGAEDLSTAVGANTNVGPDGEWAFTYKMVRSLTLLAARAAGVEPVDTLYVDFKNEAGLRTKSREAYGEGFSGRLAIHPAQITPINESFLPSPEEVEQAKRILAAFEASPGVGTVGLDGKMFDIPHLKRAQAILAIKK